MKLAALAALVLLMGVSASAKGEGEGEGCGQALCGGDFLGPFFDKLDAAPQAGQRPLVILQIGDSHSAGDNISGAWREILQSRYGAGGRGVMPPGKPYVGYIPRGVTVDESPGWVAQSIFDPPFRNLVEHATFGVSGYRLTAAAAGARLTLSADTPNFAFKTVTACAISGPGEGGYTLKLGEVVRQVTLDAPHHGVACVTVQSNGAQTMAELDVDAGPVTLTSWASFGDDGGVTVSNLGVVGAQITNLEETDDAAVAEEMRAYAPDLIVLEFGTNDGFVGKFEPGAYEAALRRQVARLKRLSGGAPMLMLSAPDADTNRMALAANAPPGPDQPTPTPTTWWPPPGLAAVRDIQRRVAHQMGVAFWNWSSRMGGPGTAEIWANADPPLIRKDRVHYTVAGGQRIAQLLDQDFEAARAAYIMSSR